MSSNTERCTLTDGGTLHHGTCDTCLKDRYMAALESIEEWCSHTESCMCSTDMAETARKALK